MRHSRRAWSAGPVTFVESEETANAESIEPMPLGERVPATWPVDQRLRQQDARVGGWRDHFMRVPVVALPHPIRRRRLAIEVVARIDLVLAVGKKKSTCVPKVG